MKEPTEIINVYVATTSTYALQAWYITAPGRHL